MASGELRSEDGELIILSVLADEPAYGYAISKSVAARSGGEVRLTPGVLYPLLAKLEKQGLITSSWETVRSERNVDEEGGRRRKWYCLSAKGKRRLEQRVQAHRDYLSMIAAFISPASSLRGAQESAE